MYDRFQTLAMRANLAVTILANPDASEIELMRIKPGPVSDTEIDKLAAQWSGRNLAFIGVMGMVDGVPQTALDVPLDAVRIAALSAAFLRHCESITDEYRAGDEIAWCEHLYSLEDPRPYPRRD